ncbi:hypothetical protein HMPREF0766_12750 [Sphingobacterium spiritivorum ATCC 33861]|uniref:Uncharacterized protein n=1 Tax=Sphingobacterium spiritivorum ATCC 33861 TaxID=525373 RepID=D7VP30_SPHSI|nr:hypothetical protein HMPREF0766_12750 [Sphingobacterium spiritivorum ATCC 33861]
MVEIRLNIKSLKMDLNFREMVKNKFRLMLLTFIIFTACSIQGCSGSRDLCSAYDSHKSPRKSKTSMGMHSGKKQKWQNGK